MKVTNLNGVEIDFNAAVELMYDEIREAVCIAFAPCTEQEFSPLTREHMLPGLVSGS